MIKLLAFEKLTRDGAIFAGNRGVVNSTRFVQDPRYIVVPGIIVDDSVIIYYSFDDEPYRLYRIKKAKLAVGVDSSHIFSVNPSTGTRKFDAEKMLSDWITKCTTSNTSSTT